MKKTTIIFVLLFTFSVFVYSKDLEFPMGYLSGSIMNPSIRIENKGIDGKTGYDKTLKMITGNSDGTCIAIQGINFGKEYYGTYKSVLIEYIAEEGSTSGSIDFSIDHSAYVIASVPLTAQPGGDELQTAEMVFNVNLTGSHKLYVRWNHSKAFLKTIVLKENTPLAVVKPVRTTSLFEQTASSADLPKITGKHRLLMVWKKQTANVSAVSLRSTKTNLQNQLASTDNIWMETSPDGVFIRSGEPLSHLSIYSVTGILYYQRSMEESQIYVPLEKGIYLASAKISSGQLIREKIVIF